MKILFLLGVLAFQGCAMKDKYGIPRNVTEQQAKVILTDIARDVKALYEKREELK